jgi:hypothetical protein
MLTFILARYTDLEKTYLIRTISNYFKESHVKNESTKYYFSLKPESAHSKFFGYALDSK